MIPRPPNPLSLIAIAALEKKTRGLSPKQLAIWAAHCAMRVLRRFEQHRPDDPRPRQAIMATRDWIQGKIKVGAARKAALTAHAAARAATDPAAIAAARAAGHAAATAHVARHALGAAAYALKAVRFPEKESAWQEKQISITKARHQEFNT